MKGLEGGKSSGVGDLVGMAEQKGLELSSLFRTRQKEPVPT